MQSLEQSAKTVDEAIALALRKLAASRDQVEVLVLSEGRSGIFGIGAEEARVRVTRLGSGAQVAAAVAEAPEEELTPAAASEQIEAARTVIEELVLLMGLEAEVVVRPPIVEGGSDALPTLDIVGEDLGLLIGRRGETLGALQFIVNLMASKRLGRQVKVPVDVEGYRGRRESSLRALALRLAERVVQTDQPIMMEEMPPAERRIVHLTLASHAQVMTRSTGEGDRRKVVILPKK